MRDVAFKYVMCEAHGEGFRVRPGLGWDKVASLFTLEGRSVTCQGLLGPIVGTGNGGAAGAAAPAGVGGNVGAMTGTFWLFQ